MKVTVFQRTATSKDGKKFSAYCAKLHRKDGGEQYVTVKFRQSVKVPAEFPAIIEVPRESANLARKEYTANEETGEVGYRYTLWVEKYTETGEKFVDHSLDDFD